MTKPFYHPYAPGPLMARLFYTFPLADGTNVSYPRQEAPMDHEISDYFDRESAPLDALRRELVDEVTRLRDALQNAVERERTIMLLCEQIEELEAGQEAN